MARQVYFDPFGQRAAGYQQGLQDEMRLQDNTRRARLADWQYENEAPLQLRAMQRADQLGEASLPYDIDNLGIRQRMGLATLAGQELPILSRIGQATANYAPYYSAALQYGSGQYLDPEGYRPAMTQQIRDVFDMNPSLSQPGYYDTLAQQYGVDPYGLRNALYNQPFTLTPEHEMGTDRYFGYDRALELAEQQAAARQQMYANDVSQANLGIRQGQLDVSRQRLQNQTYGGQDDGSYIYDPYQEDF